jgi:hypothetical protein
MSDQCKHCVVREDMKGCQETECGIHESWYVAALKAENDALTKERDGIRYELSLSNNIVTALTWSRKRMNGH